MSLLASDVMDQARVYLNDSTQNLYTNAALTPLVTLANENLELLLLSYGIQIQRVKSSTIPVTALALTLTLPADFLTPIRLFERSSGVTTEQWSPITESRWSPETYTQVNTLNYWAFYNNAINFPGCIVNRDVLLEYNRQLAIVTGPNSPEDFVLAKNYLGAKTAEIAARNIGMNKSIADDIETRYVFPAEDLLTNIYIMNMQGTPVRRLRYSTGRRTTLLR